MIATQPPTDSPALVQGSGVETTKTTDGGVVTAAQLSAGATGSGTIVIGVASEAFDNVGGGADDLVGAESAVIDLDDDCDTKAHFGHNVVAKVRMDDASPVSRRILHNSAGYYVSAQPETGFESALRVAPGAVSSALIDAPGNPGAVLARLSGDMVEWHKDRLYVVLLIDGERWGIPLVFLPKEK